MTHMHEMQSTDESHTWSGVCSNSRRARFDTLGLADGLYLRTCWAAVAIQPRPIRLPVARLLVLAQ